MSRTALDWSRFQSGRTDPESAFEEFCYQVARVRHGAEGRLLSVDDSGGGDGVEFFLVLPSGEEWGWQAKFYVDGHLTSSRRASIEESLRKAVAVHPRLTRFYLSVPLNLVPSGRQSEVAWFTGTLQAIAPNVELVLWGASELAALVNEPALVGVRQAYFGELPLTPAWFRARADDQIANVREKYDAALHVETAADASAHALSADAAYGETIAAIRAELAASAAAFDAALARLETLIGDERTPGLPDGPAAGEPALPASTAAAPEAEPVDADPDEAELDEAEPEGAAADGAARLVHLRPLPAAMAAGVEAVTGLRDAVLRHDVAAARAHAAALAAALAPYHAATRAYYDGFKAGDGSLPDGVFEALDAADTALARYDRTAGRAQATAAWLTRGAMHVFGDAGIGKTHLSCQLVRARVDAEEPALLLLGKRVADADLIPQLRAQLDLPPSYTWEDFLAALDVYAAARGRRALLVIDGLNESRTPATWRDGLAGLAASVARHPHLALVTTCRSTYRPLIWDEAAVDGAVVARGFVGDSLHTAITKYFARYKLRADLTFAPLGAFRHPLYLALFCRAKNADATVERDVVVGGQTLYAVFDEYLDHADRAIRRRLNRVGAPALVGPKLEAVAARLWADRTRAVPYEEAFLLLDGRPATDVEWDRSVTHAFLDEGLLLHRDAVRGAPAGGTVGAAPGAGRNAGDVAEEVGFTYDLLAGYAIARHLTRGCSADDIAALVASPAFVAAVAAPDVADRHPLHYDVLGGLAALLPRVAGRHLYAMSDDPVIRSAGVAALFDARAEDVTAADAAVVDQLFRASPQNVAVFGALSRTTAFQAAHPLNAAFLDAALTPMPLAERDATWTEWVRGRADEWMDEVDAFERACHAQAFADAPATERHLAELRLGARRYQWLLPSTHRLLRDRATRALYWYGRADPPGLFARAEAAFGINDPYVRERLLAAGAGVALALHADPDRGRPLRDALPAYARALYAAMFAPGATNATTHALTRDYARLTIALTRRIDPAVLTDAEAARVTAPLTDVAAIAWGESEDRDAGAYREGSGPIHMDFGNYTLGGLVTGRRNYDAQNPEYRRVLAQVWWRLYDLGYTLERFGAIDQAIARRGSLGRSVPNGERVDRYGKKYAWIAFFEQYGLREDRGVFAARESWEAKLRPSDADIDPSFPGPTDEVVLPVGDLLGDLTALPNASTAGWVADGPAPDLRPLLVLDALEGEPGPWVLLDGYVDQEDAATNREVFAFPRGLLTRAADVDALARQLAAQRLGGRWLPELPQDHYVFAGEIPWSPAFPANGWTELVFGEAPAASAAGPPGMDRYLARAAVALRAALAAAGRPTEHATDGATDRPPGDATDGGIEGGKGSGDRTPGEESAGEGGFGDVPGEATLLRAILAAPALAEDPAPSDAHPDLDDPTAPTDAGVTLPVPDPRVRIPVLLPVREYRWESYHSGANGGGGAAVPTRELAEALGLWLRLPSWDLCTPDGRRAARYVRYAAPGRAYDEDGRGGHDGHRYHMVYMRQDALDRALAQLGLGLVWGVWGERTVLDRARPMSGPPADPEAPDYVAHQQVCVYRAGGAHVVEP